MFSGAMSAGSSPAGARNQTDIRITRIRARPCTFAMRQQSPLPSGHGPRHQNSSDHSESSGLRAVPGPGMAAIAAIHGHCGPGAAASSHVPGGPMRLPGSHSPVPCAASGWFLLCPGPLTPSIVMIRSGSVTSANPGHRARPSAQHRGRPRQGRRQRRSQNARRSRTCVASWDDACNIGRCRHACLGGACTAHDRVGRVGRGRPARAGAV
jgi:hypothetical protein